MFSIFAASIVLASTAYSSSMVTTNIQGPGMVQSSVQTTVNGNTTKVESDNPGTVHVEKTDAGETVTSNSPVTVTHSTTTVTPRVTPVISPTIKLPSRPPVHPVAKKSFWAPFISSFLHSLWDRLNRLFSHL